MKIPMDLVLVVILIVLMYYHPPFITSLATSVLGTIVAIGLMAAVATLYGRNAGLLAALIFILLMHNQREGLTNNTPKAKKNIQSFGKKWMGELKNELGKAKKAKKGVIKETLNPIVKAKPLLKRKKKPIISSTNKTDLENKMKRESYVNSQIAKGENGGVGFMKKREKQ